MDLKKYRESDFEKQRTGDLLLLSPHSGESALDVGAKDGYFSKLLAERFTLVTAIDLEKPNIETPESNIRCLKGDVTDLQFDDNQFDFVFCAEVLEHIPSELLVKACSELSRVCKNHLLVGVPYKKDIRVGRTTCQSCGKMNPPWGHVNTFDGNRLKRLFHDLSLETTSFVGETDSATNFVSTLLMDLAGNPYGTYDQDESCVHCGNDLVSPPSRTIVRKALTRVAFYARHVGKPFARVHANWIHMLFTKDRI